MMKLRLFLLAVLPGVVPACVATEPVGGSPETELAGPSNGGGSSSGGQTSTSPTATSSSSTTAETDSTTTGGDTQTEGSGDSESSASTTGGLFVPCAERGATDCDDGEFYVDPESDIEYSCVWFGTMMHLPADSCEPVAPDGACLAQPLGGEEGCGPRPTCAGAAEEGVFYRELEDGTVVVVAHGGCGFNEPAGFTRCGWGEDYENPTDMVTDGPAACDCAC